MNDQSDDLNEQLQVACENGDLESVKWLLFSPELEEHADVSFDDYYCFISACAAGKLNVVKYLLVSPDLESTVGNVNIHAWKDLGFLEACQHGHLEVVKYLLTSSELKDHIDVHTQDDEGLMLACEN